MSCEDKPITEIQAMAKMLKVLAPLPREKQLFILASAARALGMDKHASALFAALAEELGAR